MHLSQVRKYGNFRIFMSKVTKLINFNEQTKTLLNKSNTYCHILQMYTLVNQRPLLCRFQTMF